MLLRLGLRTKFFLYSNTLIVVTMLLVTVIWVVHERSAQMESIASRGRSIVEAMAIPISDSLLGGAPSLDHAAAMIDNYMTQILARHRDLVRYVVVSDAAGVVTHSNRAELLGRPFSRALTAADIDAELSAVAQYGPGGEEVLEVRSTLNVGAEFCGSLAVGFSLRSIDQEVSSVAHRAAFVAFFLLLFNSILTAVYVETLIRPLLNLNRFMKSAGMGDLSVRAALGRGDEVGELAESFNRMMDELKEVSDREKVQRAQLAHTEKMAAVGTLAAGVAHEVNNPLSGVLACIENLRDNPDDVEMRERYLDLIRDGLKRIERTVANLLNFSRQREIRLEPTSVNHNLRHVVELAGYQMRSADVAVAFDLVAEDQALVMADHFQMEQLFLNLVLNAVQAMPTGGTLGLKTRARNGRVVIEIRDTGVGIPEELRDRIFDPFFTTRDVGEGTGLGLAVSDSIVAAHRGRMSVDSTPGEGSVFRVSFEAMAGAGGPAGQDAAGRRNG